MENLSIDTELLPEGSSAFVFGSYISGSFPRDLDLLIIYDGSICHPNEAYRAHAPFVAVLQETVGIPVDLTLLTTSEEARGRFVECSGAVPIGQIFGKSA